MPFCRLRLKAYCQGPSMRKNFFKRLLQIAGIFIVLLSCAVLVSPLLRLLRRHSPDPLTRLLEQADEKAWPITGSTRRHCTERQKPFVSNGTTKVAYSIPA